MGSQPSRTRREKRGTLGCLHDHGRGHPFHSDQNPCPGQSSDKTFSDDNPDNRLTSIHVGKKQMVFVFLRIFEKNLRFFHEMNKCDGKVVTT